MALIQDPNKKNQEQGPQPTGQPVSVGAPSGPPTATPPATGVGKPATSGQFTNLQKYMKANAGAGLGAQVGQKVIGQAEGVKTEVGKGQEQFKQQSQAGRIATEGEEQEFNRLLQGTNTAGYGGPGFTKLLTGGYSGPMGIQNAGVLQQKAHAAQQLGQATGTAAGQKSLLQQFYARPTYTTGQQMFDTSLLARDKSPALQQARAKTAGLENQTQAVTKGAEQQAKTFRDIDETRRAAAQQAFEREAGLTEGDIANAAAQQTAQRRAAVQNVQSQLASGKISDDLARQLGVDFNASGYVDPSQFVQYGATDVGKFQAANTDQARKLQALRNIAGGYQSKELSDVDWQNLGKNVTEPAYNINKDAFQAAQADLQQKAGGALSTVKQASDAAENLANSMSGPEKAYLQLVQQMGQEGADAVIRAQDMATNAATPKEKSIWTDLNPALKGLVNTLSGEGSHLQNIVPLQNKYAEYKAAQDNLAAQRAALESRFPQMRKLVRA